MIFPLRADARGRRPSAGMTEEEAASRGDGAKTGTTMPCPYEMRLEGGAV